MNANILRLTCSFITDIGQQPMFVSHIRSSQYDWDANELLIE